MNVGTMVQQYAMITIAVSFLTSAPVHALDFYEVETSGRPTAAKQQGSTPEILPSTAPSKVTAEAGKIDDDAAFFSVQSDLPAPNGMARTGRSIDTARAVRLAPAVDADAICRVVLAEHPSQYNRDFYRGCLRANAQDSKPRALR